MSEVPKRGAFPVKTHKFNASAKADRTFHDPVEGDIVFSSKMEMKVYEVLVQLFDRSILHKQPRFELQPAFVDIAGTKRRPIMYVADFIIGSPRLSADAPLKEDQFVIDVKGMETPEYALKEKLFAYRYNRVVVPVKSLKDLREILVQAGLVTDEQCNHLSQFSRSRKSSPTLINKGAPSASLATEAKAVKFLTSS